MKHTKLAITLAALTSMSLPAYAETRAQAMAGAGVSNGSYIQAGYLNPALMAHFADRDHLGLVFPSFGFEVADTEEVIDAIKQFQRDLESLETLFDDGNASQDEITEAREQVRRSFQDIDGDLDLNLSLYAKVAIPTNLLAVGLYVKATPSVFAGPRIAASDIDIIEQATNTDDLTGFNSAGLVVGSMRTDVGLALAKSFDVGEAALAVGVAPKFQRLDSFAYAATIESFDDREFDSSTYSTNETVFNIDIGMTYTKGNWSAGIVGRNLVKQTLDSVSFFNGNLPGEVTFIGGVDPLVYEFEPEFVVGFGYQNSFFSLAADADVLPQNYLQMSDNSQRLLFGDVYKQQFVRVGIEFDAFRTVQLRLGYRHDLEGLYDDTFTAGLGLSPFGRMHINLAGSYSSDKRFGAGFQFAFTF